MYASDLLRVGAQGRVKITGRLFDRNGGVCGMGAIMRGLGYGSDEAKELTAAWRAVKQAAPYLFHPTTLASELVSINNGTTITLDELADWLYQQELKLGVRMREEAEWDSQNQLVCAGVGE